MVPFCYHKKMNRPQIALLEEMNMHSEATHSLIQVGSGLLVGSILGLLTIVIAIVS